VSSPGASGFRSHAADDHVAIDPSLLRRRDQLHRASVVHRLLAPWPAPRTGAGGEHYGIGAGDRLSDLVLASVLQIDHCRLGAGLPHLVGVVAVADQADGLVAAP
jgi:hypothetical protein